MEALHQIIERELSEVMNIVNSYDMEFSFVWSGYPVVDHEVFKKRVFKLAEENGLYAFITREDDLVSVRFAFKPEEKKANIKLNILLLIITFGTTIIAGTLQRGLNPLHFGNLIHGFPFAITIMVILGSHELGHYFAAKRHGVVATLPYFIPAPSFIGTFGAVISLRSPIPDRKALVDIGAAGPITGFVLSIFAAIIGLKLSTVVEIPEGALRIGNPLIFSFISHFFFKSIPQDMDVLLHPVAFAGWLGFFVTGLNLLPVGQLDGGHILYAFFPRIHRIVGYIFIAVLFALSFIWPGWLVWSFLLLLFIGVKHPPPMDTVGGLDNKRIIIGWLSLLIFVLTFIPVPFM